MLEIFLLFRAVVRLKFKEEYKNNENTIILKNVHIISDKTINTSIKINKDCEYDKSIIKTYGKFIENVQEYCIDEFEDNYEIESSSDIHFYKDRIIYVYLGIIKSLDLKTGKQLDSIDDYKRSISSGFSFSSNRRDDIRCSCKYKDRFIFIGEEGLWELNAFNFKVRNLSYGDYNKLTSIDKVMYANEDKVYIYADKYSGYKRVEGEGICYRWNLNNLKNESEEYACFVTTSYRSCIWENKLYMRDGDWSEEKRILEISNGITNYIELEQPKTKEFSVLEDYCEPESIKNFIVKEDKIFVIWGEYTCSLDVRPIKHCYKYSGCLVVYDLHSKNVLEVKRISDNKIIFMYSFKEILITLDILGQLKLFNIDDLSCIGTIKIFDVAFDDNIFYKFVQVNGKFYDKRELAKEMKKLFIEYDELSDKIFIRCFNKIFILG